MAKKIVTMKSVTDADLQSLQNSAGQASDVEMAAIAELARVGAIDGDDWAWSSTSDRRRITSMSQREALKECVEVIAAAQREEEEATYRITADGQYLREHMREATVETLSDVLDAAAAYVGETAERETWDDGTVVQGCLTATPVVSS
jgi:uncharacterized tellurite resistance protein B-like protein